MGCDIHAFVEYRDPKNDRATWQGFGQQFRLWRNYLMFGVLAGVRAYGMKPVITPRGVPKDVGYAVVEDYTYYIVEDKDYNDYMERNIAKTKAEKWVENGSAEWWDKEHKRITSSDYHTGSWVTPKELEKCFYNYRMENEGNAPSPDYEAILTVMQFFESEGLEARLVFWFDN
jgi:hypothetical protein